MDELHVRRRIAGWRTDGPRDGRRNFEQRCARIAAAGSKNITARLFNGEYFFNIINPKHTDAVNSGDGSHIDQVYGQSSGLPGRPPAHPAGEETRSALQSLWKYGTSPRCRRLFHRAPARPPLRQCGRCRHDHVYLSAHRLGIAPRPPAATPSTAATPITSSRHRPATSTRSPATCCGRA